MPVDLTQILIAVIGGTFSIISAVAVALVQHYVKDQRMATLLETALQNSLGKLQQATTDEVRAAALEIPNVPVAVAPAVQYILNHAGETLKYYGITEEMIADKIIARIGVKNIQTNIAIAGSNSNLVPEPISPVPATADGGVASKAARALALAGANTGV